MILFGFQILNISSKNGQQCINEFSLLVYLLVSNNKKL